jgi:ribosomal protein S18 acetylase RimI-like enzyme
MNDGETTGIEHLLEQPEVAAWLDAPLTSPWPAHNRLLTLRHGLKLLVRPLEPGDERTVADVFEQLGEKSRRARFLAVKPRLGEKELRWLAAVDARHHALVAYVHGDARPVAIARLVRAGSSAEVGFEVADRYQRRGIGAALTAELLKDARAAGIREITAVISTENDAALGLLRRLLSVLHVEHGGPELLVWAPLTA